MDRSTVSSQISRSWWTDSGAARVLVVIAYVVLVLLLLGLALVSRSDPGVSVWKELGRDTALIGFALLALQVVLGSRMKLADGPFGLDAVMRFHKYMAILACALLVAHPVLLAIGSRSFRLFTFNTGWKVSLGKIGLTLVVLITLAALYFRTFRMDYQTWRVGHKGAMAAVVLGGIHAVVIGSDFKAIGVRGYGVLLLVAAVGIFLYRNIFFPVAGRHRFQVASIEPETPNTWTLTLEPEEGDVFGYRPGQFVFLKLVREGQPPEEHPFSISSSPTQEGRITVTVKESGDFTRTIGETRPTDRALVEGPFGRFSLIHRHAECFLFIAGGVGITPIMSMLRYLRDTNDARPVTLLYGNRTEQDIVFRDELEQMPDHVKVVHVLSEAREGWDGPRGRITEEMIRSYRGDAMDRTHVYLCGPPSMMGDVTQFLRSAGMDAKRIHDERFAL